MGMVGIERKKIILIVPGQKRVTLKVGKFDSRYFTE